MTAELEMFKRQINLVEFAGSMGYELLQKESSRHSKVMRGPSGKIVIATDAKDGHGIYFSVGSEQDSGTIIDFLQRRGGGKPGPNPETASFLAWSGQTVRTSTSRHRQEATPNSR